MIHSMSRNHVGRAGACAVALAVLLGACNGEEATPVDLDADPTTTSTAAVPQMTLGDRDPADDPNAAERKRVQELAEQQCLDDPDKVEGVIRIVDPATDQVVSEFVADCAEVRADQP